MAKKRKHKDEEKEKPAFVAPKFDEKEFMENDIKNSKIALLIFVYAITFAIISTFLTRMGQWPTAMFVGFIGIATMSNVFGRLNMDLTHLKKKDWIGNYVMFFFAWLGIWILLCNPPFTDMAHPDVEGLAVYTDFDGEDKWETFDYHLTYQTRKHIAFWNTPVEGSEEWPTGYYVNKPCNVTAVVTDNVGVENVSIEIIPSGSVANPDGSITILSIEDDDPRWSVLFVCHEPGDYFVKVHVRDVNGNEHIMEKDGNGKVVTFKVLADTAPPQAAPIFLSSGGDLAYNLSFNEDNRVTWLNHSYQNSSTGEWPNSLQNNTEANFTAVIVDNTGVASANLTIAEKGDDNSGETYELILWEGNWTANFTLPGPGEYNLIIRSTDVNGNTHVLKVDYYGDRLSIWVR